MAKQFNVLVICGSLRKGSFNAALTRALPALAPPELNLIQAPPYDSFPIYNADIHEGSGFPGEVTDYAAAIRDADAVLIVTPEYNWSIPGGLKNMLDWVSRLDKQPFENKPVAIQSASQGPLGGARMQYHMRMAMTYLKAFVFGTPEIFVGQAQNKFDKDTLELKDQPTKEIIKQQLAAFVKFIERVKG